LYAKLERFLEPAAQATLVVAVEHAKAVLELVVTSHGETHTVIEEEGDLRTALDKTFHTMDLRLRRAKERRADHHRTEAVPEDGFAPEPQVK
jgi:ribosome-associated translation inhibitor RaiA